MVSVDVSNMQLTDLIELETIQGLQDSFSEATGVASLITDLEGNPITRPSNFQSLCNFIRSTKKGQDNCLHSDAILSKRIAHGNSSHKCFSGCLWDGGASISVQEYPIANWLIGQVRDETYNEAELLAYAKEIGVNGEELVTKYLQVPVMSKERFEKLLFSLHIFANELSNRAYQSLELQAQQKALKNTVTDKTLRLETTIKALRLTNQVLNDQNEVIKQKNATLKSTLDELKAAQVKLVQSEKLASLGILTAGVAHEINNPLNFIMGAYTGLQKIHEDKSYEKNTENISLLLKSLKVGLDRASHITKGLNQFSRDSQRLDEDCDIHAIIENCLTMLRNQTKQRIIIDKQFQKEDLLVKGNAGNLHQVFLNLINNSVQAIPKKGKICIETSSHMHYHEIKISDTGVGIKQEFLNKIKDPFFTTKPPGKGTGLGLSISQNIIADHKGEMLFSSKPGQGTKVVISLPRVS
jgi:signal transduction histidine kinase